MAEKTWHRFTEESIQENASNSAGVYQIDAGSTVVYVGQSRTIRDRLLEHKKGESDQSGCINGQGSDWFRYELIADEKKRLEREKELIEELNPVCNQK